MIALFALITAVSISLLITRVATLALTLTGLSREAARFQARSAFTGVGFTTSESEMVVNHPVRRRILMTLMLVGNAGIITVVATLVVTFTQGGDPDEWLIRMGVLALVFAALWFLTWNWQVDQRLSTAIAWGLRRWAKVDARDYAALLQLSGSCTVMEMQVMPHDWLADKALGDLDLTKEGVLILGIHRPDGTYIGTPKGESVVRAGDVLILYGRADLLDALDRRRKGRGGDRAHAKAVSEQQQVLERQKQLEREEEEKAKPGT